MKVRKAEMKGGRAQGATKRVHHRPVTDLCKKSFSQGGVLSTKREERNWKDKGNLLTAPPAWAVHQPKKRKKEVRWVTSRVRGGR